MVKCIKQILDKSKLVLKYPVNSYHTKLDKSKLVWNNPVMVKYIKQIIDKSKLVWNNPVNVKCIKQILNKSKLVWNNPANSRHTKLDKSKLVRNNPGKHELTWLFKTSSDLSSICLIHFMLQNNVSFTSSVHFHEVKMNIEIKISNDK
jgi:hypothetical protein